MAFELIWLTVGGFGVLSGAYGVVQARRARQSDRLSREWQAAASRSQAAALDRDAGRRHAEDRLSKAMAENDSLKNAIRSLNSSLAELQEKHEALRRSNRTLQGNFTRLKKKVSAQGAAAKQGG